MPKSEPMQTENAPELCFHGLKDCVSPYCSHAAPHADKDAIISRQAALLKEYYDKHFCMDDDALVPERCKLCIKAAALLLKESL